MKSFFRVIIILALLVAGFYGYKYYRVRTAGPPMVEVDTGTVVTCVGCGKVLERNVQRIKVPMTKTRSYRIDNLAGLCESCRAKGVN